MTEKQAANFIRYASIAFFFTALILASGAFAPIDGLSVRMYDLADWPLDGETTAYTQEARWFSAIGGGLFAGLSVLLFMVIAPLIEQGSRMAARGLVVSMLVWFVIDSAGSIAAGVPANAAFNVLFLAMLIGPVLAIRRPFGIEAEAGSTAG